MPRYFRILAALLSVVLAASCSLPRGAALQSEIVNESRSSEPTFQVMPVTRANMAAIETWPATGNYRTFNWLGHSGAPDVNTIATGSPLEIGQPVFAVWAASRKSASDAPGTDARTSR